MSKLHECKYRIGFTGTLDGANVNQLVLEGLFGRCSQVTRTNQLMKAGHVAKLKVKIVLMKHEEKLFEGYQNEIEYLIEHEGRNKFIRNLACDLKGNTLVLFNYVERHGVPLYELINSYTDRPVHFVHGGVDVDDREDIRLLTEQSDNTIIVASYGTFSTGINIKKLHNIIFASPSKSRVRNLQSIGRVLRKGENKSQATLYDIADDISTDRGNNYTLNHLMERVKIYNQEKFNYEIIDVKVKTMINYAKHDEEFYGIFKLLNGEEILGKSVLTEDNGETLVFIQNPVAIQLITKEIDDTKVARGMGFTKWQQLSDDDFFILREKDIITVSTMSKEIAFMYESFIGEDTVEDIREERKAEASNMDGYLGTVNDARKYLEQLYKKNNNS